jgi:hypothetical protein
VVSAPFVPNVVIAPVRYQNTDLSISPDRAFAHGGISDFSTFGMSPTRKHFGRAGGGRENMP